MVKINVNVYRVQNHDRRCQYMRCETLDLICITCVTIIIKMHNFIRQHSINADSIIIFVKFATVRLREEFRRHWLCK